MEPQTFSLPENNPFPTLDVEISRLNKFFTSLDPQDWKAATHCQGWTVRDMVAHLDSDEEYNEACLNDTVGTLIADFTSLDDFNNRQIQKRADLSNEEILHRWRDRQAHVRERWEELGLEAKIPTFIGPYPLLAQIWHITSEYATHADDMGVPVLPADQNPRLMWRFQFSAFAVQEKKNPPGLARKGNRMMVFTDQQRLSLSEKDFVSAVSARLPIPKDPRDRKLLAALRALA
ncbi:MAG: maleylpyruvate isomerase family mycothiol-dependent enzyme [Desulfobacterales bacterium]